jgi:PAS domain S-box-containing protein
LDYQYSPYILPLIAAALASGWVAVYAWTNRRMSGGAPALAWLALAITVWASSYALEIAGADLPTKIWWGKVQYIGIAAVPPCWLIFAINHTYQSRQVARHTPWLLAIIPVITIGLIFTTESHGLLWREIGCYEADTTLPTGNFTTLDVTYGPWFWVHSAYSYILLFLGTVLILRSLGHMRGLYRGQAIALLLGVAAPWLGNALYLSGLSPIPHLDLTPFAFAITMVAMAWGIFGVQLINMAPLARDVVVDEMQDAMVVLDIEGRIADMNPAAERLIGRDTAHTGSTPSAETPHTWSHVIATYRNTAQASSRDTSPAAEEIVIDEGKSQHWYEIRILPLKNRHQRVIGRALLIRDITDQRQLDEQLRQLSRAVEASPVSIVITDADGRIEYVNPKFTQVTGYTFAEALGQNPRILKTDKTPPEVHVTLWETLTQGREWRGEFCNRKKNGEIYWEFASISPIIDAAGTITHYVAVKEDITARKRAEAERRRYMAELEASNAELDAFAHTVAHDLKNPLTAMLGFSMLLETHYARMTSEQIVKNLHTITRTGQKMTSIINELLLLASVRQMEDVATGPLDMATIVTEALERLQPMIAEHGADIVVPETWPTAIGYPAWVEAVWTNYISNAIKYGGRPEENIPPRATLGWTEEETPSPAQIRFWVRDNGPGLREEERQQLFTQFTRLHEMRAEGHGLGLSIVQRIVTKLGGSVGVESSAQGSCFYFTLPQ